MKKILICIFLTISLISCKKAKLEFVSHNSEIFINKDSLFIGTWEYLYTRNIGGYINATIKTFENLPSINIKPMGNYENMKNGKILATGKIDTVGHLVNKLLIVFYPNGVKTQNRLEQPISTLNRDTLILGSGAMGDVIRDYIYIRIR